MTYPTPVGRERRRAARVLLALSTALAGMAVATPATAQLAQPAPVRQSVDGNGVDLFAGTMNIDAPALTIGQDQGLSYFKLNRGMGWTDNLTAVININSSRVTITFGGTSDSFTLSGGTYASTEKNGATLTFSSATNIYTYTRADGTVMRFSKNRASPPPYYAGEGRVIDVTQPSGNKLTYAYDTISYCGGSKFTGGEPTCTRRVSAFRISSVRNSYGYKLVFSYLPIADFDPDDLYNQPDLATWSTATDASVQNLAVAPGTTVASASFAKTSSGIAVTDPIGRVTTYRQDGAGAALGITRPGSAGEDVTIAYANGRVSSVTTPAGMTSYASSDKSDTNERVVTVSDPLQHATVYAFDLTSKRMKRMTRSVNGADRTWSWAYDDAGRMTDATAPEGNQTHVSYDARGNVIERREIAKPGSGVPDIVTSAVYPADCANAVTCNQPTTTTDAHGQVTDYAFDSTHGGVLSVTLPAASTGAARAETRYGYQTLQAYFDNGTGIVASGEPVVKLTSTSTCRTSADCVNTDDETVQTVDYGPQAAGTGNNLLPVSQTARAGDDRAAVTTATSYDPQGNPVAVDGPLPGADDTTRSSYNAARELVSVVTPDPDGAGPLRNRATVIHHTPHGLADAQSVGTANPDGSGFTALQVAVRGYDAADRVIREEARDGAGNAYSVTQYGYDAAGRLACSVQRMNPAAFGATADPCALGPQGADGPDRSTQYAYDDADRVNATTSGWGTAAASTERAGYTANGQVASVTDGANNRTELSYDGFDRLVRTTYPSTAVGANAANGFDYEEVHYTDTGDLASRRLRDGQVIGYGQDLIGRTTSKVLPGGEGTLSYGYDLVGHLTSASRPGSSVTLGYDALGRLTSDAQPFGTVVYGYDEAGRQTRVTHPDGFFAAYRYDTLGELTQVRENDTLALATIDHDDLGRRTKVTRGNGTVTTYGFQPAAPAWLSSLNHGFGGGAAGLQLSFGQNAAGQLNSRASSNDAFDWAGYRDGATGYGVNGLNQLTVAGAAAITHDARGNLTGDGVKGYAYSSENLLKSATGGVSLDYDPLGRLSQYDAATSTRFYSDAAGQLLGEIANPSGAVRNRYVFGEGPDEALASYDGAGARHYLHADERGSVVAASDDAGTVTATNRYDEHGRPGAANQGRFGYTGQAWLPELGLYYYKARMYSPKLGRFLQTDPIGYADGLNWYNYVGGDPVNNTDPSGLGGVVVFGPPRPFGIDDFDNIKRQQQLENGIRSNERGNDGGDDDAVVQAPVNCLRHPTNAACGGMSVSLLRIAFSGSMRGNAPQIQQVAQTYTGDSFCSGATVGRANRFNPFGRINSGKVGGYGTALNDVGRVAAANGIKPLGDVMVNSFTTGASILAAIPHGLGDGWYVSTNPISGYTSFSNSGLTLRYNASAGLIRIDIPSGFNLPNGGTLAEPETCHYR